MTKSETMKRLAESWGGMSSRQADEALQSLIAFITKTVKTEHVLKIPNLGTFHLRQLQARTGRNPHTGEAITIPARTKVGFTPAKGFKEALLGPS
jgi:nucleoid DNA-binding protein